MYVCCFIVDKCMCVAEYMYVCCDVEVDDEGGKYPFWSDICMYVALSYMCVCVCVCTCMRIDA